MSKSDSHLSPSVLSFVEQVKRDTAKASRILWETRTLSASRDLADAALAAARSTERA